VGNPIALDLGQYETAQQVGIPLYQGYEDEQL